MTPDIQEIFLIFRRLNSKEKRDLIQELMDDYTRNDIKILVCKDCDRKGYEHCDAFNDEFTTCDDCGISLCNECDENNDRFYSCPMCDRTCCVDNCSDHKLQHELPSE